MKYDEKIGKLCRFYQKGKGKKGDNCNFTYEYQQAQPVEPHREAKTWDKPKVWQKAQGQKQWKSEHEEEEQPHQQYHKKGTDRNEGGGDYDDCNCNTKNKNKYQGHVSGTASYSSYGYSPSSAPRKHSQSKW